MSTLENVSRESLEKALKEIRTDVGRLHGVMGIVSGDSDFWLVLVAWIGMTNLIQFNWHWRFDISILISGSISYGLYRMRLYDSKKRLSRFLKEPLEMDTDVNLS